MKKYLLSLISLLFAQNLHAQIIETPFCATDQFHEQKMATDTAYAKQFETNQQLIKEFCDPHNHAYNENNRDLVVLPMVVHIVSPVGTPIGTSNNITDTQVEEGLQLLNNAFANAGSFNTPDGVDTEIRFCLAQRDPNGQPTTGITRHYSNIVADASCGGNGFVMGNESTLFSLANWDCCQYINVYLVTDITDTGNYGCSIAGYATVGSPCGYMIQESQFWTSTYGTQVTAHEMGHFFGLWHTFQGGCTNANCLADGDAVCDTPPDNETFSACNANSCNSDTPDLPDDTQNYMDYGACTPWHFTQGQKVRMIATLQTVQNCLLNSQACDPVLPLDASILFSALNNTCGTELCPELTLKNTGINTLNSIEITYNINGGTNQIYNYNLPLLSNATTTITLPCLTLGAGVNTLNITVTQLNGSTDNYASNSTISSIFEVFPSPTLAIAQSDSTRCGNNGFVQLQATGGKAPYQYQISGNPNWQLNPNFSNLQNIPYTFTVKDANNCTSTLTLTLPNACPPCISGIINKYAPVTAFCGNATIEISSSNGFQVDDKVLLIQMQGATIATNNDSTFGNILDYGNAGNYEFNRIGSINANSITFQYNILRTYDLQGKVQLVTVPEYADISVCNLTCPAWNGETGGILVLDASGTITMAGNIDVSQKGFRGGLVDHSGDYTTEINYYYDNPQAAAKKGEGIALYLTGKEYGKGKQANGAGGGHNHNSGGGGGANGGNGGFGGYSVNPDSDPNKRGIGGIPVLIDNSNNKLFMGGGAGAGHSNWCCAAGTSGGNGGGILFVKANSIVTNNSFILANGENALSTLQMQGQSGCLNSSGCDGAGGGGAGGTVFIDANTIPNPLTINAIGGNGGDNYEAYGTTGPGGGGSGGYIIHANTTNANEIINIAGGINGFTHYLNILQPYGATEGQIGAIQENITTPIANVPHNSLKINITTQQSNCNTPLNTVLITVTGGVPPYQYALNNDTWQPNNTFQALGEGTYIFSVKDGCNTQKDTLIQLFTVAFLSDSLLYQQPTTCSQQGKIVITGKGGTPPYQYQLNGGAWQNSGTFSPLSAGTYTVVTTDANGCSVTQAITISHNTNTPILNINKIQNITCDSTGAVILTLSGSNAVYPQYNLDNDTIQSNPTFTNLTAGSHTVTVIDELGCTASITFNIADSGQAVTINNPQQICLGNGYTINGNTYTQSGEYTDTLQTITACDSIIITQLTVNNPQNPTCNDNNCNTTDFFNEETCQCEHTPLTPPNCNDNNPETTDTYNPETCACEHIAENNSFILIPNAFSPNDDGVNDFFTVKAANALHIQAKIYNRWGELVYENTNSTVNWDGTFKGNPQQVGVYAYFIIITYQNGSSVFKKGNITLIK